MSKEVQTPNINYCEDEFVCMGTDKVINIHSNERVWIHFIHVSENLTVQYEGNEGWCGSTHIENND